MLGGAAASAASRLCARAQEGHRRDQEGVAGRQGRQGGVASGGAGSPRRGHPRTRWRSAGRPTRCTSRRASPDKRSRSAPTRSALTSRSTPRAPSGAIRQAGQAAQTRRSRGQDRQEQCRGASQLVLVPQAQGASDGLLHHQIVKAPPQNDRPRTPAIGQRPNRTEPAPSTRAPREEGARRRSSGAIARRRRPRRRRASPSRRNENARRRVFRDALGEMGRKETRHARDWRVGGPRTIGGGGGGEASSSPNGAEASCSSSTEGFGAFRLLTGHPFLNSSKTHGLNNAARRRLSVAVGPGALRRRVLQFDVFLSPAGARAFCFHLSGGGTSMQLGSQSVRPERFPAGAGLPAPSTSAAKAPSAHAAARRLRRLFRPALPAAESTSCSVSARSRGERARAASAALGPTKRPRRSSN